MRLSLREIRRTDCVAYLQADLPAQTEPVTIRYGSRTGALLRVDGAAAGAFDREHRDVLLPQSTHSRTLLFEVELFGLPTNGLPSGDGLIWRTLNVLAHQRPPASCGVAPPRGVASRRRAADDGAGLPCIGHSHLDVAWLWTYGQTRRKAERTFAIACDLLDRDPRFVFAQSQPQLYAFVEETDPRLFERVRSHVASNRFDADVAAFWVESDCNVPSGESLLRQMFFAFEYCTSRFGVTPRIAWLPDTFGFPNTLPQLLAHAGIPYFATTKLQWNDTTKFPYPQFLWEGPDGSGVTGALLAGYDGGMYPWRILQARSRHEPLVAGYGDGGGGVTPEMLEQVEKIGRWIRPGAWFEELTQRRSSLPVVRDELYLEYHRGVFTTHHDVKAHNALLERSLGEAEELLAWCVAVHASKAVLEPLVRKTDEAWRILLRNQFHDVLPGTSIGPVYRDVREEYAHAEEMAAAAIASAEAILPRSTRARASQRVAPAHEHGRYRFQNEFVHAALRADGAIVDLRLPSGRNVCTPANVLSLYEDKPRRWEAWNIDDGYVRRPIRIRPQEARIENGALTVDLLAGSSPASMRIELFEGEPFLRVTLEVDWQERRRLLRVENRFAVAADTVRYGTPHGTILRSARTDTAAERAKFEVPGARFACASDAGGGAAMLVLDTYGWSARTAECGVALGHSVLRGTCWPDPRADAGQHLFAYAFAPLRTARTSLLEAMWRRFAHEPRVRLFTTGDESVVVTACKPAADGDGVIVRVRECDGAPRTVALRCGARMTHVSSADALERALDLPVGLRGEDLLFDLGAHQLRAFRVRFSHGA